MSKQKSSTFGPNEFDIRVRERFLASGLIDQPRLQKHLGDLKDVEASCETVTLEQPALTGDEPESEGD